MTKTCWIILGSLLLNLAVWGVLSFAIALRAFRWQ